MTLETAHRYCVSICELERRLSTFSTFFVPLQRGNNVILGTGWVSELNPRKGVLTFDNGGHDERVLILASKVYIFERRLGARQYLSDALTEGL